MSEKTDEGPTDGDEVAAEEIPFEAAYAALEQAVRELEEGEQSLDEALALYEQGTALAERCNALLATAELRIRQIDEAGGDAGPLEL